MSISQSFQLVIDIINENQGIVTIGIFVLTIVLGWISGIFKSFRRKPELKIETIQGPTFVCVFRTGGMHRGHEIHRTGIALYLRVTNVGISSTSITSIKVGYHWNISIYSFWNWIRYRLGWFYLSNQVVSLADFQSAIGDNIKIYPFLMQKGFASGESAETFLESGRSTSGVVYFEQEDSWGGCFPVSRKDRTKIRIVVCDSFGRQYQRTIKVDCVSLEKARHYNPKFGATFSELYGS